MSPVGCFVPPNDVAIVKDTDPGHVAPDPTRLLVSYLASLVELRYPATLSLDKHEKNHLVSQRMFGPH